MIPRLIPFALAGLALTAACLSKAASAPVPVSSARFGAADPHRCIPAEPVSPADFRMVRACAEEYVRLNGYTPERSHADTTLLAREPFEVGSWDLLLEKRRYAIDPKALLADCDASGCIVYFRRFVRNQGCLAVSMSRGYERLHLGRPVEADLVRRAAQLRCG